MRNYISRREFERMQSENARHLKKIDRLETALAAAGAQLMAAERELMEVRQQIHSRARDASWGRAA